MVYNVTPYMDYHPGGEEELMKAAGIDGTELFDQVLHVVVDIVVDVVDIVVDVVFDVIVDVQLDGALELYLSPGAPVGEL